MKITAEVSGPPQYGQASPYYIDNDPDSAYYGELYALVKDDDGLYAALSMTRMVADGKLGITRSGWHCAVKEAVSYKGSSLSPLVPILPPRTITIEIKP